MPDFRLNINGEAQALRADAAMPLLHALRGDLGLRAAHFGCGLGQCGSCHVLVDGASVASCALAMDGVANKAVVTLEGLQGSPELTALQQAFEAEQAAQCGYCLSGILVSAVALLRQNPAPTRADVVAALDPHLCRCGAHNRMLRAVERAAAALMRLAPTS